MHGQMSYRRFGRARSLRSDRSRRAWLELGRYVATELRSSSCQMSRVSSAKLFVRKNLFQKIIRRRKFSFSSSDVLNVNTVVTVFDSNNDILVFCGDLDVNFVVTVFDPNT
ncbi:hypothetical protein F2Q70_00013324 [Brassica cretica]|uniref:Uncharacterized protein n=1 Tax=Brassica cretica TaxID=69181 RepID=A0A8S9M4X8_BRACR|nr:hypothetical protein F2Q70_00013324 [Brassica cretica]